MHDAKCDRLDVPHLYYRGQRAQVPREQRLDYRRPERHEHRRKRLTSELGQVEERALTCITHTNLTRRELRSQERE